MSQINHSLKIILVDPPSDVIINCIALADVDLCAKYPDLAQSLNSDYPSLLSSLCRKYNKKLVHISSDQVYGDAPFPHTEDTACRPVNVYASSKLSGDQYVLENNDSSLVARLSFFGNSFSYKESFSDKILNAIHTSTSIPLFVDAYFNPISIENFANALSSILSDSPAISGILNFGSSTRISKFDFGMLLSSQISTRSAAIIPAYLSERLDLTPRPFDNTVSIQRLSSLVSSDLLDLRSSIANEANKWKYHAQNLSSNNTLLDVTRRPSLDPHFIPYSKQYVDEYDVNSVVQVLRSPFLTQGPTVQSFEESICAYTGAKYCVAVSSGTAALHLSLMAAKHFSTNVSRDVYTSPNTFVATSNSCFYNDLTPKFIDIDPCTASVPPKSFVDIIANNSPFAVIPVHFGGASIDLKEIYSLAQLHKTIVIEDAAHAFGGLYPDGGRVGSSIYSDLTILSFHPVKSCTTGEGGAITTNNEDIYRYLLRMRSHGIVKLDDEILNRNDGYTDNINPWYYEMQDLGFHYRITDIQASLGLSQLKKLDKFIDARREHASLYDSQLDFTKIKRISLPFTSTSAHHLYTLSVPFSSSGEYSRASFMHHLRNKGIGSQVLYIPVPLHPFYSRQGYSMMI